MSGAPFMGGQHLHHHPQQVSAMKSQSSGLLYQNIPLPGSAGGGGSTNSGGPSSNMSGLVMPGQAQGQCKSKHYILLIVNTP